MNKCPGCGSDISEEMRFCPSCGLVITEENELRSDSVVDRERQRTGTVLEWVILCVVFLSTLAVIAMLVRNKMGDMNPSAPSSDISQMFADDGSSEPGDMRISEQPQLPTPEPTPEPSDEDLVYVRDICPEIAAELHYATTDNFTGVKIYDFTKPQLRYGTAKKLLVAEKALEEQGYCLKIWDAYRPVWAQFRLWEICPDSTYVANPYHGYSSHSRGNTIDLTLIGSDGSEVEMPSGFDDFSAKADRDYSDVSDLAALHARILEKAMTDAGFVGYRAEWWHYSDSVSYPVIENG